MGRETSGGKRDLISNLLAAVNAFECVCSFLFMQSKSMSHWVSVNILACSYSRRLLTMKDNYHFSMQGIEPGAVISSRNKMAKSPIALLITSFINELQWRPFIAAIQWLTLIYNVALQLPLKQSDHCKSKLARADHLRQDLSLKTNSKQRGADFSLSSCVTS